LANILKLICFLVERGRGAFVTFMISLRRIQMFLLTYLLAYLLVGYLPVRLHKVNHKHFNLRPNFELLKRRHYPIIPTGMGSKFQYKRPTVP